MQLEEMKIVDKNLPTLDTSIVQFNEKVQTTILYPFIIRTKDEGNSSIITTVKLYLNDLLLNKV